MRFLLSGILILLACRTVDADTAQERARALNRRGMSNYDLGNYSEALVLFQSAYEVYPEPKILFNIAQTHRKQRNYEKALEGYRAYLRYVPDAPNRHIVEERIAEIEKLLSAQNASDDKPPEGVTATAPAPEPAAEAAAVSEPEFAAVAPLANPPLRDAKASKAKHWYQDRIAWTIAAVGVAVALTGSSFLLHAQAQKTDLPGTNEGDRDALRSDVRRNQLIGDIGLGVGAAVIAGAIVKFKFVRSDSSPNRVQVSVAARGIGVLVHGRF